MGRSSKKSRRPCKTIPHGTLPNELRERYGLPPIDEDKDFRDVRFHTWWDKAERERKKAEREAEREAARERWENRKTERSATLDARGPVRNEPRDAEDESDALPDAEEDSPDH